MAKLVITGYKPKVHDVKHIENSIKAALVEKSLPYSEVEAQS